MQTETFEQSQLVRLTGIWKNIAYTKFKLKILVKHLECFSFFRIRTSRFRLFSTNMSPRRFAQTPSWTRNTTVSSGSFRPRSFSQTSRPTGDTWKSRTARGWRPLQPTLRSRRRNQVTTWTSTSPWRPQSASVKFFLSRNSSRNFSEPKTAKTQKHKNNHKKKLFLSSKLFSKRIF